MAALLSFIEVHRDRGERMTNEFDWPEENLMEKSNKLLAQLDKALGARASVGDWLGAYRSWLDAKAIRAEVDGWPSPEAFSQINVRKFIKERLDAKAS